MLCRTCSYQTYRYTVLLIGQMVLSITHTIPTYVIASLDYYYNPRYSADAKGTEVTLLRGP